MDEWMLVLIWVIAPFAELVIIIVMAVINYRQKAKIAKLTEWLKQQKSVSFENAFVDGKKHEEEPEPVQPCPPLNQVQSAFEPESGEMAWGMPRGNEFEDKGMPQGEAVIRPGAMEPAQIQCGVKKPARHLRASKGDAAFDQGTAALIVGVIFVVLAGLIFATTTWYVLPGFGKVILAFAFSAMFFGASYLAGQVLKIKRSSQAFYILGSVFLFLTVLAGGYFGFLGPEFILKGENRWRVLFVGSIVTEAALFAGLKSFRDKIYIQTCFWGVTVSMAFFMEVLGLGFRSCVLAMTAYSFLLVIWDEMRRRKGDSAGGPANETFPTKLLDEGLRRFAPLHFWIFSVVMGLLAVMDLVAMLLFIRIFNGSGFFTSSFDGPVFMFLLLVPRSAVREALPWNILCLGLIAAGIVILALRRPSRGMKLLHSVSLALLFQYAGWFLPGVFSFYIPLWYLPMLGGALTGIWFLAERGKKLPLANGWGGGVFTAILCLDTLYLLLFSIFQAAPVAAEAAISGLIVLLAVIISWWGRQRPSMGKMVPWVLFLLTITMGEAVNSGLGLDIRYDVILLVYVAGIGIWDVVRGDDFWTAVLAVGTVGQIVFWLMGWQTLPFFILLSVYLFASSRFGRMGQKEWGFRGGCLYFLAGSFIHSGIILENGVLRMMLVTVLYVGEYAVAYYCDRERKWGCFWEAAGLGIFLMTMGAFYMDSQLKPWNLALCIGSFAGFYVMLYFKGRTWMNLAAVLAVIPVPVVVWLRYTLTSNELHAWVGGILLVTGSLARWYRPIICKRETPHGSWDIDWFHILFVVVLLFMALMGNAGWRCVTTALIGLYVLQYISLEGVRRQAFTLAMILGVLAFWEQPFVHWPSFLSLEINLLPAVLFIWLLPRVWKDNKVIPKVQTALYCVCLGIMVLKAYSTGDVEDALIVEGLCLVIFIWSHVRKCIRWARISGITAAAVALYMTKDFWFSLSWWVYLLAAGIGLIVFAAVNEIKKH